MKLLISFQDDADVTRIIKTSTSFRAGLSLAKFLEECLNVKQISYLAEHEGSPSWFLAWERDDLEFVVYSEKWNNLMLTHQDSFLRALNRF